MNKEQERTELYSTIWKIANDLRGSVDGWDFKQYVLGMLFYRFISENLTDYLNRMEQNAGNKTFHYEKITDKQAEIGKQETVEEKGFYILPSELFVNVRRDAKNNPNLNVTLSNIFKAIENSAKGTESEEKFKGLFDDLDVNSNKLGATVPKRNEVLVKLLNVIGDLKLGNYQDNTIDAFGDAYEFLMTMYASNAGKSGGEFFTPQEVSELLAQITVVGKTSIKKVYDPACGSGSLLLKFAKVLGRDNVTNGFYGQEINITTYNLCRINMFLHDINYNKFDIKHGNTLLDPKHLEEGEFDAIVSNPPYSTRWEGDSNPLLMNDPRFRDPAVLAPKAKADLAFTLHMLYCLSSTGTAAIVEFPGVLYRNGTEQKIRQYLVERPCIDTIIQLPPNLFFGTNIATCIIVLKKNKSDKNIFFIDASKLFIKDGNKNKLGKENREKILDVYIHKKEEEYFSKMIDYEKIREMDYNLSVNTYIEKEEERVEIDIHTLNSEVKKVVKKQEILRKELDNMIKEIEEEKHG